MSFGVSCALMFVCYCLRRPKCCSVCSTYQVDDNTALSLQCLMDFLWVCLVIAWPMAPWPLSGSWQTRSETCRPPVWRKWGYKRGVDSQTNEADNLVQQFTTALFLSLTSQSAKNMKILRERGRISCSTSFAPACVSLSRRIPSLHPLCSKVSRGSCLFSILPWLLIQKTHDTK